MGDSIIVSHSFISVCYFLEIRMRTNGEGDYIRC